MTNKFAISVLKSLKDYYNDAYEEGHVGFDNSDNEALDLAIKALEQQPCEDCISREDLLEKFTEECASECACCMYVRDGYSCGLIEDAPSVTPQRPKGKWKPLNYKDEMWGYVYKCSNCGHIDYGNDYCPHCGARMESDKE